MVTLIVAMATAYQVVGNVMYTGVIVPIALMKLTVVRHLLVKIKDYGIVAMANVSMLLGNVMDGQTVLMEQMKLTALLLLVQIKDYGIVVMDSVFHQAMYVMDQVNFVMLDGVLTVLMAQMKA
jgi:hypothetical protein